MTISVKEKLVQSHSIVYPWHRIREFRR